MISYLDHICITSMLLRLQSPSVVREKSYPLCKRECLSLLEQHAISYPTKLSQQHFPISATASLL